MQKWHAQRERRPRDAGGLDVTGLECQAWSVGRRGFYAAECVGHVVPQKHPSAAPEQGMDIEEAAGSRETQLGLQGSGGERALRPQPRHCFRKPSLPMAGPHTCAS